MLEFSYQFFYNFEAIRPTHNYILHDAVPSAVSAAVRMLIAT